MTQEIKFSAAEINLVIHATEDHKKVLESISDILPVPVQRFSYSESEGHFGNKISLLAATLASEEAYALAQKIISSLNSIDRDHLSSYLQEYTDERGNLYLRLNKQRLCQGKISLSEEDSVRIRFRPVRRYKPGSNLQNYRGLLSSTE